jgi:FkbM family methyltransferase
MSFFEKFYKSTPASDGKLNFIDVGSAGLLPSPWNKREEYIDRTLKFEPRDSNESKSKVISVNCALWENESKKDFYIYEGFNQTGSSLFLQNFKYVRENFDTISKRGPENLAHSWIDRSKLVRIEMLNCETLDNVLRKLDPKISFDFLKIDAQGAEYQILKGANTFLQKHCQGIVLELFSLPLYEGIKLEDEVTDFLKAQGFQIVKRFPPHGTFNSQRDCLFLRNDIRPEVKEIIHTVYEL